MLRRPDDILLLTPGPVSVSHAAKAVMLVDRPSGDAEFQAELAYAREYLVRIANGGDDHTAIPLPGSATYANEAARALLAPPEGKLLVHSNGVYGEGLIEVCKALGIAVAARRTEPFTPPTGDLLAATLQADPAITHAGTL